MMRKPVVEKAAFLHDERQRRVKPKRRMWTAPDAAAVQRQGTGRDGLAPRRALTWPVRQSETRQPWDPCGWDEALPKWDPKLGTRTRREIDPARPDRTKSNPVKNRPRLTATATATAARRLSLSSSPRRLTAASQPHPPLSSASPGYKYPPARISRDPPSRSRPLPAPPPRPAHELRRAPAPASAALRSGPPVKARTSKGRERGKGEAHPPAISRLRILSCSIRVGSAGVAKHRGLDGGGRMI